MIYLKILYFKDQNNFDSNLKSFDVKPGNSSKAADTRSILLDINSLEIVKIWIEIALI